jgi:predicted RNA-binding protein with TRAM domain
MGCGSETASVSMSFDGNTVVSGFVVVVDDD